MVHIRGGTCAVCFMYALSTDSETAFGDSASAPSCVCCAASHHAAAWAAGQIVQQRGGASTILEYFWSFVNAIAFFFHVRIMHSQMAVLARPAPLSCCCWNGHTQTDQVRLQTIISPEASDNYRDHARKKGWGDGNGNNRRGGGGGGGDGGGGGGGPRISGMGNLPSSRCNMQCAPS